LVCDNVTYTAAYSNGTSLDSNIITFAPSTRTFTVASNLTILAGTYPITINGTSVTSDTVTFNLIIVDPCPTATLSYSTVSDVTLAVLAPTQRNVSVASFSSSVPNNICG
jgi:hypothetical protein